MIWGLILDIAIAWALAEYLGDGGFMTFIFAYVGIQALLLVVWLRNTILQWTFFKIAGRKRTAAFYADYFQQGDFPEPDEFESSAEEYLNRVADDETVKVDTRIKAAFLVAFIQYPVAMQKLADSLRLNLAMEDALESYKAGLANATRV
ncbi:MAG: hypothetical protein IH913_07755 [Proteobacteria bacterium]|nr:hypothetical protein [Pseudomonadota bacterium]